MPSRTASLLIPTSRIPPPARPALVLALLVLVRGNILGERKARADLAGRNLRLAAPSAAALFEAGEVDRRLDPDCQAGCRNAFALRTEGFVESSTDGSYENKPFFGGMREGVVRVTPPTRRFFSREQLEILEAARTDIVEGRDKIFEGLIRTNDGRVVGRKGVVFEDDALIGNPDWYFENARVIPLPRHRRGH
ncbi:MAG: hypothetical protein LBO05_08045 [Deltaproteobacteria bacterium]|jgi:hypothetical protein|nr:hypothetical protein [Deltaproteobacteria bacterium]